MDIPQLTLGLMIEQTDTSLVSELGVATFHTARDSDTLLLLAEGQGNDALTDLYCPKQA